MTPVECKNPFLSAHSFTCVTYGTNAICPKSFKTLLFWDSKNFSLCWETQDLFWNPKAEYGFLCSLHISALTPLSPRTVRTEPFTIVWSDWGGHRKYQRNKSTNKPIQQNDPLHTMMMLKAACWWTPVVVVDVQLLSCVRLFVTPADQASLAFTVSQSLLRLVNQKETFKLVYERWPVLWSNLYRKF